MSSDLQIRRINGRISALTTNLEGSIESNVANLTTQIDDINIEHDGFTLPAEIARATAAGGVNATDITNEIARATAAEGVNAIDITNE